MRGETYHRRLVSRRFRTEDVALLDKFVCVLLVPEAYETSAPRTSSSSVHSDASIPQRTESSESGQISEADADKTLYRYLQCP